MTEIGGRRSIRLRDFDYSQEGAYFVTICTHNRALLFDLYPALKEIILFNWAALPERFPVVNLDQFVIMPNHFHGIVAITHQGAHINPAGPPNDGRKDNSKIPQTITLGKVIGVFKSLCASDWRHHCRVQTPFAEIRLWQRNYYDHIIRNDQELNQIREYILQNPLKWELDPENPSNIKP